MDSIIPPDDTPLKQCKGPCGQFLPATPEYFHRGIGKYGVKAVCKKCRAKPYKGDIIDGKKHCSKCDKWKPATPEYFGLHKNTRSGFAAHCKECRHEYNVEHAEDMRQYQYNRHHNDRERVNHLSRLNYHRHGEHNRAHKRQYRKEHRDRTVAANRKWYFTHFEQVRDYHRGYRKNNPDKVIAHQQNRRARKKAVSGSYTAAQVAEQLKRQRYKCYYADCGFAKFKKVKGKYVFEIEHTFPLTRVAGTDIPANSMSYLVLSCKSCNSKKHDKFPWEWFEGGRLL